MKRKLIKAVKQLKNETVEIAGFVQAIRDQGSIAFLVIRDVTGELQVVVEEESLLKEVDELTVESVVHIQGDVRQEEQAPDEVELIAKSMDVLSKSDSELPIPVVEKTGEVKMTKRLDYRWLDLRKPEKRKIFATWTEFERGLRQYLDEHEYMQVYPPTFMKTASESGSELFKVEYFDGEAYLAQSPQFYKQMAMASGFEKVFMFSPVFRAEPSFTSRHTTEYTGFDVEVSYINSHIDVMKIEEELLSHALAWVKSEVDVDIEVPVQPFPKVTFHEAKEKLSQEGFPGKPDDLSTEEEKALGKIIKEEKNHDFVFVTDYPVSIRPFYHMRHKDKSNLTKSFDLLYKGLEITTGSQREHRIDILERQAKEEGISLDSIDDYINFFRYGCPPHGGMGVAPVRIITQLLDLGNIREATFVPRDVKRLNP